MCEIAALEGVLVRQYERMMATVDVELLVVPECPNEGAAAVLLRRALNDVGLARTRFTTTVIGTAEAAGLRGFIGSPTILLDGVDPFPQAGRSPAVACRLYPSPAGPSGLPELTALRRALKEAAATTAGRSGFRGRHR